MHPLKTLLIAQCLALSVSSAHATQTSTIKVDMPLNDSLREKAEVEDAFAQWRRALAAGNPENVVKLYEEDAVLLATLAPKPVVTQEERLDYFAKLARKPKLSVTVEETYVKLLDDDNAVLSGLYTFRFEENGSMKEIPARYSFVYEKTKGKWMIAEHHSSKVPN